jgi:Spy/CpxP family protein refolding chaperone
MKRNLLTVGSLAVVLAAGLAIVGLEGCGHHRPDPARAERMINHRVEDGLDDLKATPEQRQKVLAVKDHLLARWKALRGDHQATMQEALSLWEAPGFDRARALAMVDAHLDAMRTLAHEAVDAAAEVHDTLTPEQRAQLARRLRRHAGE